MAIARRQAQFGRAIGPDTSWALGQLVLVGAIVAVGMWERRRGRDFGLGRRPLGKALIIVLLGASAAVALRAKADLGRSFTMSPTPVNDGALAQSGVYGTVRHPMYLSVEMLLCAVGIALGSWLAVAGAGGMLVFFLLKAAHEERLLVDHYPGYAAYRVRVRWRIIPRLL